MTADVVLSPPGVNPDELGTCLRSDSWRLIVMLFSSEQAVTVLESFLVRKGGNSSSNLVTATFTILVGSPSFAI